MKYIVSGKLLGRKFRGMAIFPFIIMKRANLKKDKVFINHESIHLRQQLELLIIPFFIMYGLEFIVRLFQYKDPMKAYKNLSFEREAYSNEDDLNYLNNRTFWSFLKYYKNGE